MSGRRVTLMVLVVGCLVLGGGANNEESDYVYNEIDLVPTYRTGIEKALQGLASVVSPGSSGGSSDGGGRISKFLDSLIPSTIKNIVKPAQSMSSKGFGEILNIFEHHFHAIFPGTLWCGGGNIAKSEDDVGFFEHTDACCREHDNCPWNIQAGKTEGNLLNNGIFTRSACSCDRAFYDCLRNVKSVVSSNIGSTYFNILRPQCFAYDYPIESCAKYGNSQFTERKCLDYNLDYTQNQTLNWFDSPDF